MAIKQNTTPGADEVIFMDENTHDAPRFLGTPDLPMTVHRFNRLRGEIHNVGEPGGQMVVIYVHIRDLASHSDVMDKIDAIHKKCGTLSGEIMVSGTISWTSAPATFLGFRYDKHFLEGLTNKWILQGWLMWRLRGPSADIEIEAA